jgi:integrase
LKDRFKDGRLITNRILSKVLAVRATPCWINFPQLLNTAAGLQKESYSYRYLLPDEEPRLMAELSGPRAHLKPAVIVALGTGMRLGEQLRMKRSQVDFLRNIITARKTKNGRPRDIPMNDEVRETLAELCKDKRPDDYVSLVLKIPTNVNGK